MYLFKLAINRYIYDDFISDSDVVEISSSDENGRWVGEGPDECF